MSITTHLLRSLSIATALLVTLAGLVAYGKFVNKPTGKPQATALVLANHISQSLTDGLEIELITVKREGFEPSEIVRPKGPFVLLIDDRSGKETSSFQLQPLKGERLRDVNTNRKRAEWYDVMNLPPGVYLLTELRNPGRHSQITILP